MTRVGMIVVVLISLAGCASKPATKSDDALAKELAAAVLKQKLSANGPAMFCSQEGYRACFRQDRATCTAELSPKNGECMKRAERAVGAPLQIGLNDRDFAKQWGMCMTLHHALLHADRVAEIGGCLQNVKWDKDEGTRALLQ